MRRRRTAAACAAALMLAMPALADSWQGQTVGADTVLMRSPCAGTVERLALETGQRVSAGDEAGEIMTVPVFAPCDGTVAAVLVSDGERADDETVVEIEPIGRYRVVCTVKDVAKTGEMAWVRCGETLWMKCTPDGSHRAAGIVTMVNGPQFEIETTAGDLYIGETVWISRDPDCRYETRIGKGTVTTAPTVTVIADGIVSGQRAAAGASVRRGQLLFRVAPEAERLITAPASGIVTEVRVTEGQTVQKDEAVAVIARSALLQVQVPLEQAVTLRPGDTLRYYRGDDPHETLRPAAVVRVLTDGSGNAAVELRAEEELPIGLSVTVTDDEP